MIIIFNRSAANFSKDTVGYMDATTNGQKDSNNSGMTWRTNQFSKNGGRLRMFFRVELDIFYMNKLVPSGVKVKILMKQTNNLFRMMTGPNDPKVKLRIINAKWHPQFIKLDPMLILESEKIFADHVALLPFTRCDCTFETLPSGAPSFRIPDAMNGIIPSSMIIMFTKTLARLGDSTLNPYNFIAKKLQKITVQSDTEILFELICDFPNDCTAAYFNLFANKYTKGRPVNITKKEFTGGYCMIFVELSSPIEIRDESGVWHKQKTGKISINIQFKDSLTESIDCLIYGFSLDCIQVNHDRHCLLASHLYRKHM